MPLFFLARSIIYFNPYPQDVNRSNRVKTEIIVFIRLLYFILLSHTFIITNIFIYKILILTLFFLQDYWLVVVLAFPISALSFGRNSKIYYTTFAERFLVTERDFLNNFSFIYFFTYFFLFFFHGWKCLKNCLNKTNKG